MSDDILDFDGVVPNIKEEVAKSTVKTENKLEELIEHLKSKMSSNQKPLPENATLEEAVKESEITTKFLKDLDNKG